MAVRRTGGHWFGDSRDDLRAELTRYSKENGYPVEAFWEPVCATCGQATFRLQFDDDEGAAYLTCPRCDERLVVADSEAEPSALAGCFCERDEEVGEVVIGAALFRDSHDVRWLYVGWRAPECGLMGVYVEWKLDGSVTWPEVVAAKWKPSVKA